MRKIVSKGKQEKKQKRNQLIIGGVMIFILSLSIVGYGLGGKSAEQENKITYKGYEFVERNGFWITEIGNFEFSFMHNPNDIEEIDSDLNLLNSYSSKPLYISSEDMGASNEIYRNLFYQNKIVQRMQLACLEGGECEDEGLPIKTCEDKFIIIREAKVTEVVQNNSCVFIEGKIEDLTKITDGFLLNILGI